ncbi:MAG: histidinol dehydrogenase [Chloroflexota bacterium]
MKIIEGFARAKARLSRQKVATSFAVSPSLQKGIEKLFGKGVDAEGAVRQILEDVRTRGDAALRDWTLKIDRIQLDSLEVTKEQVKEAYREVDKELVSALQLVRGRLCDFHAWQRRGLQFEVDELGMGVLVRPLGRVGVYVPGGLASYPSTVLMTVVPAKVAGVKEVIMVTPSRRGGKVPAATLVAADITGVDRIFSVGGAQAVAALAFGTETIPQVDKVCGPGNVFVVLAKKLVYGVVAIDGLQGPSEVMVVADETADPDLCAADLLAQAEHDPLASAVLVTDSPTLAKKVNQAVEKQLESLERQKIIRESWDNQGLIVLVDSIGEAVELANLYAPEHLLLAVKGSPGYIGQVRNAGCLVVGENPTVVLGDYAAGPSHVLPTGGTARFGSPLNITDFVKLISLVNVDEVTLGRLGGAAVTIARAEGLEAHARAIEKRLERLKEKA